MAVLIGMRHKSKLTPGTIYPALKFLRKKRLVALKRNGRKKIYSLTIEGKKEFTAARKTFLSMFGGIYKK